MMQVASMPVIRVEFRHPVLLSLLGLGESSLPPTKMPHSATRVATLVKEGVRWERESKTGARGTSLSNESLLMGRLSFVSMKRGGHQTSILFLSTENFAGLWSYMDLPS